MKGGAIKKFSKLLLVQGGMILFILAHKVEAWVVTSNPSTESDIAYGITHDGTYLYIGGFDYVPGDDEWRIEKRNLSDGALQWTKTSNPSTGSDEARAITNDGTYLYVAGWDYYGLGDDEWRIEKRRMSDGGLVWVVTSNPSTGSDEAFAITHDGTYLYVAGYDKVPGNWEWRIEKRRMSDGGLVWVVTSNPSPYYDFVYAITNDGTYLYVAGDDKVPGNREWRIEKRNLSDGALQWAKTSNPSRGDEAPWAITNDGTYLYVAGNDYAPGNWEWRIEKRRMSDGGLVWVVSSNPSRDGDGACAITQDGTYLYVAGFDNALGYVQWSQWRVEKRNLSDGALQGTWTNNPSKGADGALAITQDGNYLYVAGNDYAPGNSEWRIEQIDPPTGIEISDSTRDERTYFGRAIPNPFTQKTVMEVRIARKEWDKGISPIIQIYDLGGRVIKSLPITNPKSPITKVVWDGRDNDGKLVPKGIYFCSLKTADITLTRKLIRIK